MSEMIERVARALAKVAAVAEERKSHLRFYQSYSGPEEWVELNWRSFVPAARAAIAAMREPTDEMLLAGSRASADPTGSMSETWGVAPYMLKSAWAGAIDAALQPIPDKAP